MIGCCRVLYDKNLQETLGVTTTTVLHFSRQSLMLFEAYQLLFYSTGKTEKTFFLIYSSYLLIYKLHQCLLTVIVTPARVQSKL